MSDTFYFPPFSATLIDIKKTKVLSAIISFLVIIIISLAIYIAMIPRNVTQEKRSLTIDQNADNYGQFFFNSDDYYFSTYDPNVKNIIRAYFTNPSSRRNPTLFEKYGSTIIPYYTKTVFIAGKKYAPTPRGEVSGYSIYATKTGTKKNTCNIFADSGFYKDDDLLLSATLLNIGTTHPTRGICLYLKGDDDFQFIDLSSELGKNENIFKDPMGQSLKTKINVDAEKKTATIAVYNTTKKDADGNYIFKRNLEISY